VTGLTLAISTAVGCTGDVVGSTPGTELLARSVSIAVFSCSLGRVGDVEIELGDLVALRASDLPPLPVR